MDWVSIIGKVDGAEVLVSVSVKGETEVEGWQVVFSPGLGGKVGFFTGGIACLVCFFSTIRWKADLLNGELGRMMGSAPLSAL